MVFYFAFLKKFPVISRNNNQYFVIIEGSSRNIDLVKVKLYEKNKKRNIFGKEKESYKPLNANILGDFPIYEIEKWDFNYKKNGY